MKLKVIITGVSGMVGEGVLHECLAHTDIMEVLTISRKEIELEHPKLKKISIKDFFKFSEIEEQVKGYDACFFCLGISSIGLNEQAFSKVTYDLTMAAATILAKVNPDMTFCYISGVGTDSTEKGRIMWARVKGKTENDLIKMFKNAYMFRPGYMQPTKGLQNTLPYYKYIKWTYPFLRAVFPKYVSALSELGMAMINSARFGYPKQFLEVSDIVKLAKEK